MFITIILPFIVHMIRLIFLIQKSQDSQLIGSGVFLHEPDISTQTGKISFFNTRLNEPKLCFTETEKLLAEP
jgi:hypothetical protein